MALSGIDVDEVPHPSFVKHFQELHDLSGATGIATMQQRARIAIRLNRNDGFVVLVELR